MLLVYSDSAEGEADDVLWYVGDLKSKVSNFFRNRNIYFQ
jgi:hypothetical protein